ncbi:MAG TPA: Zn-dependent hydrolase, partial [Rhodobacteraceae bacterium]|nr:Zn-dependent hydrolase [Paracoccaceae bacterium]
MQVATDYAGFLGHRDVVTMNFAHETHTTAAPEPR